MNDYPRADLSVSFSQQQEMLVDAINEMGDVLSQYTYLVEISAGFPAMADWEKERASLVDRCQSQVWISCVVDDDGAVWFHADSDTLIVRGVLYLMMQLVNGRQALEMEGCNFDFVEKTELADAFSDERLSGFSSIQQKMTDLCKAGETS